MQAEYDCFVYCTAVPPATELLPAALEAEYSVALERTQHSSLEYWTSCSLDQTSRTEGYSCMGWSSQLLRILVHVASQHVLQEHSALILAAFCTPGRAWIKRFTRRSISFRHFQRR